MASRPEASKYTSEGSNPVLGLIVGGLVSVILWVSIGLGLIAAFQRADF
jgi:hypothetical protein